MIEESELDTFIFKFKQLWRNGLSAHLDLETSAGKAWVGMRLDLGDAPGPQHVQDVNHQKSRNSPAKEWCRNWRRSLRKNVTSENLVENEIERTTEEVKCKDTDIIESTERVEKALVKDQADTEIVETEVLFTVEEPTEKVDTLEEEKVEKCPEK